MATEDRVKASALYDALEGMIYIAVNKLGDSPRRESNRIRFMDAVERIISEDE